MDKWETKYFNWRVMPGTYTTQFIDIVIIISFERKGWIANVNGKELNSIPVSFEAAEYAVVMYLQKIANRILDKFPNP